MTRIIVKLQRRDVKIKKIPVRSAKIFFKLMTCLCVKKSRLRSLKSDLYSDFTDLCPRAWLRRCHLHLSGLKSCQSLKGALKQTPAYNDSLAKPSIDHKVARC